MLTDPSPVYVAVDGGLTPFRVCEFALLAIFLGLVVWAADRARAQSRREAEQEELDDDPGSADV